MRRGEGKERLCCSRNLPGESRPTKDLPKDTYIAASVSLITSTDKDVLSPVEDITDDEGART